MIGKFINSYFRFVAANTRRRYYLMQDPVLGTITEPRAVDHQTPAQSSIRPKRVDSGWRLLRDILREEETLPIDRVVWFTLGICAAVDRLHRDGIVHGRITPASILIGPDDRVKLVDNSISPDSMSAWFGVREDSSGVSSVPYLAPEQVSGKCGHPRSDVYATGAVLYELLTGTPPFNGFNPVATMYDRLANHPVPPREIRADVSPQLQEIVYRALERDPKNRYPGTAELAWDLAQQDRIVVKDRRELKDWKKRRSPTLPIFWDVAIALVPVLALALLFYVVGRTP